MRRASTKGIWRGPGRASSVFRLALLSRSGTRALATIPLVRDSGERNPVHWNGVQFCETREADGVYLRDPECLLFKEWAREDLESLVHGPRLSLHGGGLYPEPD